MLRVLKNLYASLLIHLIVVTQAGGYHFPFSGLVIAARLSIACLLPFIVPLYFIKFIRMFVTNKDLEDMVNGSKTILAIYRETSEFEWRSVYELGERIYENIPKRKVPGTEDEYVLEGNPLAAELILMLLTTYRDVLFRLRLENREEYVERNLEEVTLYDENDAAVYPTNPDEYRELFGKQFDVIVRESGDDFLKGVYLGRELLATKINVGKKQPPPPVDTPQFTPS